MAIIFDTKFEANLLYVVTKGVDESLEEVQHYAASIIEVAKENQTQNVLLDERELEYRLGTVDTYQLAEFTASIAPIIGKVALVPNPKQIDDARFYENVVSNRGVRIKAFKNTNKAIAWLKS